MSISWKNSKHRYGLIAMLFHWAVALMFLAQYIIVYYRHWFTEPKTPANWTALQLHLSVGVTVMVFVILRLLYKWWDQSPDEVEGTRLEHLAAKLAHTALYLVMIIMPITGYLGTGANTEYFSLFEIPQFRETSLFNTVVSGWLDLSWQQFEPVVDFIHKQGGKTLVWMLIAVHASAALYHHYVRKDQVLKRMLLTKNQEIK